MLDGQTDHFMTHVHVSRICCQITPSGRLIMYVRKPVTLIPVIVTWQSVDGEPVAKVQVTVQ